MKFFITFLLFLITFTPTFASKKKKKKDKLPITYVSNVKRDSVLRKVVVFDIVHKNNTTPTSSINIDGLLWFAKQQLGTPYKYASADPQNGGLDCSGFLYYIFGHYKVSVPRSSKDYMNYGITINKKNIQKGDVLVFTGSDASKKVGGHVGLVLENEKGNITFIHGSSGKGKGVTISNLSEAYYTERFLKVVRIIK
ncbi:MAG TPA: C40 family peptidase [Chitinophagales bacterium]|jgi:cell wall-associated NlpC family hydrolase|nr:C40 family peptidase [Chitinophagales bacterium]HQW79805.1 C40 family peptidase [Chitinophagales bacterium]